MAHVLEGSTDKWWRFDDETVTAMPEGPIGEKADHGLAAGVSSAKKVSFCVYGTAWLDAAELLSQACLRSMWLTPVQQSCHIPNDLV